MCGAGITEDAEKDIRSFAIDELLAGLAQWLKDEEGPQDTDEVCGCHCGNPALSATCWVERLLTNSAPPFRFSFAPSPKA